VSFFLWLACADLTVGERVLGEEVVAQTLQVAAGQGRVVGLHGDTLISTDDVVMGDWRTGQLSPQGLQHVRRVGLGEAGAWAWLKTDTVLSLPDGAVLTEFSGRPSAVDRCPNGEMLAVYGAGESVSCAEAGVLVTVCEGPVCDVRLGEEILDTVSPGGALSWLSGVPCWGDPMLEDERASGAVRCGDGTDIVGMEGDHLGLSLAGDRAAGRFNRHIVPPRLRIVSLSGADTWLIDTAAENSRVALAVSGAYVAIGVADFRRDDSGGRIYVVGP
jgi:hypothetical protein